MRASLVVLCGIAVAACSTAPPSGTKSGLTTSQPGPTLGRSPAPTSAPTASAISFVDSDWILLRWPMVGNNDGIWLSRPDGSERRQLVPQLPGGQASPAWSPDGAQIVFAQRTPEEAIWISSLDGSDARQIVAPTEGCCGQDHPNWSPDGKSISFMRWLGPQSTVTSQVTVYNLDDSSLEVVATASSPTVLDHPRWSPDGSTLAVEVAEISSDGSACTGSAIGLVDVASGELTVITGYDPFFGYPSWRPDGQALLFDSYGISCFRELPDGASSNLFTANADGSELTQLTLNGDEGPRATQPFWGEDGTIVYVETTSHETQDLFLRYMTESGEPLPEPDKRIRASYPRSRPD